MGCANVTCQMFFTVISVKSCLPRSFTEHVLFLEILLCPLNVVVGGEWVSGISLPAVHACER